MVKNLDTGEAVPLSVAEEKLPKCTNPLALQIMRLTSEFHRYYFRVRWLLKQYFLSRINENVMTKAITITVTLNPNPKFQNYESSRQLTDSSHILTTLVSLSFVFYNLLSP